MRSFPIAKINLGLNIVAKRPDGYHDLETVFMPVNITDTLDVQASDGPTGCDISLTGVSIEGDPRRNLVVRAYELLATEFQLPHVSATLHKRIPTQAGMGGGSSDAAYMLMMLNDMFCLGLSQQQLTERAAKLGADCPFFIMRQPSYGEGIGERLSPVSTTLGNGSEWLLAVVKPPIAVSTREAFSQVVPKRPAINCREVVTTMPVSQWRQHLTNDFEPSVFALHPELATLKRTIYDKGAAYAAMSGSGSAMFGLFHRESVGAGDHNDDVQLLHSRLHSAIPADSQLFIVSTES